MINVNDNGYLIWNGLDDIREKLSKDEIGKNFRHPIRGESNKDFKLSCSLFRNSEQNLKYKNLPEYTKRELFILGRDYLPGSWDTKYDHPLLNKWPTYIDMNTLEQLPMQLDLSWLQHIEVPTHLLDCSYDIYSPLYFLANSNSLCDGKLYVFNIDLEKSDHLTPLASQMGISDHIGSPYDRIIKQKAMFLKTMMWVKPREDLYMLEPGLAFCDISLATNISIDQYLIHSYDKQKIIEELEDKFGNLKEHFGI